MAKKHHGGDIFYGSRADTYSDKREATPAWRGEHAAFLSLILRFPDGSRVLDAPVGTGRFLPYYFSRRMNVTGLDISADMLGAARREKSNYMAKVRLDQGSTAELSYDDDTFDLVVSFRFLSGIVPSGLALKSVREFRRVAPRAILQMKCRPEALPPIKPPCPDENLGKRYYRRDMDALFHSTGFRIEAGVRIDEDPTGNRWAFAVVRC